MFFLDQHLRWRNFRVVFAISTHKRTMKISCLYIYAYVRASAYTRYFCVLVSVIMSVCLLLCLFVGEFQIAEQTSYGDES